MKELMVNDASRLEQMSLDELFNEAARYGNVTMFSNDDTPHPNCYKINIEFRTRQHTTMSACSDRRLPIKSALIQAIFNAEEMVNLARQIAN